MEKVKSYTLSGKEGMEKIASAMKALRAEPIKAVAGSPVLVYEDHNEQLKTDLLTGVSSPTGLPKSNALRYLLPGGAWVVIRPSGTEPKLKLYIGAVGETEEAGAASLDRMMAETDAVITGLLQN